MLIENRPGWDREISARDGKFATLRVVYNPNKSSEWEEGIHKKTREGADITNGQLVKWQQTDFSVLLVT